MSDVLDDLIEEFTNMDREDIAIKMIKNGESEEKIVLYSKLPMKRVKELVEKYKLQPV